MGGVQADVVLLFRPAAAAVAATLRATAPGETAPVTNEGGGATAPLDGSVEEGSVTVGGREGAVLTIVIRPLPSTAPASVDSGSSRGGERKNDLCFSYEMVHVLCVLRLKICRVHHTYDRNKNRVSAFALGVGGGDLKRLDSLSEEHQY